MPDPDLEISWGGGTRSSRPLDKGGGLEKIFSSLLPSVWSKNRGVGTSGPSPTSATANWEIRHHSLVCCCGLADILYVSLSPGGYSWKFFVGVCRPVLQILNLYQTQRCSFHTRFQTRPLKSIPVFRPGLQAELMLSLLRLERKQKISSNPFRIRIFLYLTHLELKR